MIQNKSNRAFVQHFFLLRVRACVKCPPTYMRSLCFNSLHIVTSHICTHTHKQSSVFVYTDKCIKLNCITAHRLHRCQTIATGGQ